MAVLIASLREIVRARKFVFTSDVPRTRQRESLTERFAVSSSVFPRFRWIFRKMCSKEDQPERECRFLSKHPTHVAPSDTECSFTCEDPIHAAPVARCLEDTAPALLLDFVVSPTELSGASSIFSADIRGAPPLPTDSALPTARSGAFGSTRASIHHTAAAAAAGTRADDCWSTGSVGSTGGDRRGGQSSMASGGDQVVDVDHEDREVGGRNGSSGGEAGEVPGADGGGALRARHVEYHSRGAAVKEPPPQQVETGTLWPQREQAFQPFPASQGSHKSSFQQPRQPSSCRVSQQSQPIPRFALQRQEQERWQQGVYSTPGRESSDEISSMTEAAVSVMEVDKVSCMSAADPSPLTAMTDMKPAEMAGVSGEFNEVNAAAQSEDCFDPIANIKTLGGHSPASKREENGVVSWTKREAGQAERCGKGLAGSRSTGAPALGEARGDDEATAAAVVDASLSELLLEGFSQEFSDEMIDIILSDFEEGAGGGIPSPLLGDGGSRGGGEVMRGSNV